MARDFYKRPNLKRENVKPTRLVDFENIAKQFKINIRLFEPRENEDKTAWRLVFGMALSANDFDDIIKPEMKEFYFGDGAQLGSEAEKKNWLVTDEYSKRVPGLFKAEFQGKRMIALTSKCYFADNGKDEGVKKFSCKGVSRRQNKMNWERYKNALFGSLDKARNIGFRKRDNHIVTYEQSKLGLSAYYDKRIVHEDGIHTSCL